MSSTVIPKHYDARPTFPVSPASSVVMSAANEGPFAHGHRQSGSTEGGHGDDQNEGSSNSDGPSRKRRRSRKGLDKKFECSAEGCGKSYSRAEHLYRHQLNHSTKQTFRCEYPDCPRTFVRGDLLKRHMDRHAAKGSQLNRRDSVVSQAVSASDPSPTSPDATRSGHAFPKIHPPHMQYQSPQDSSGSPYTPIGHTPPAGYQNAAIPHGYAQDAGYGPQTHLNRGQQSSSAASAQRPRQPSDPYSAISPVSNQTAYHSHTNSVSQSTPFVSQQNVMPFNLPPSQYVNGQDNPTPKESRSSYDGGAPNEYPESNRPSSQAGEMMMLDQMSMPAAGPVFGGEGALHKSPYVGMPEDFMAYLFNSLPGGGGSPAMKPLPPPCADYGDLQSSQYSVPYLSSDSNTMGYFPTGPQQVMAVNNLLDQDVPEASISEEKSQELFDFIKDRFHENELQREESIFEGDRTNGDHMLSKRMMQAYIGSYWYHFSDQMPILHKPTFSSDKAPNLLLLAMITIGAACLDRTHGQKVTKAGAKLSNFLAWHIRWEIFMDPSFRPPAKLWVFQTLILLELYEKMYSTRELHERAHIHHATTITLMRRGRSLIGKSTLDSPPNAGTNGSRHSSTSGVAHTPDEWWNHWITNEATRRAAFAAFCIDSFHATMFGHSGVMVAHEMRLPLPCDESLWRATSSAEVGRVEANLMSRDIKPISFLEGLKRTLSHQEVKTTSFGRMVLMAGLLSVTYHMHQRDLQVNVLGGGVIQSLGGRDKWRATLTRAYDSWKVEFDKALEITDHPTDPYRHSNAKNDLNFVLETRTVLHHLAHMAMHADIVDCQMFARAKRLLGRSIGPQEFNSAQRRIRDYWAPSARARDATYYALKFLRSVLLPGDARSAQGESPQHLKPYEARDDVLLNRPWVLYFAALVVWCYGFALEGPCLAPQPTTDEGKRREMRMYLETYGGITDPNELRTMRGINQNTALLMVLKDAFESTRWELLHEGSTLLRNCIVLNSGSQVV